MNQLKITLIRSGAGRLPNQRATLEALGLRKINKSVIKPDNPPIRGMINTVQHLLQVEELV